MCAAPLALDFKVSPRGAFKKLLRIFALLVLSVQLWFPDPKTFKTLECKNLQPSKGTGTTVLCNLYRNDSFPPLPAQVYCPRKDIMESFSTHISIFQHFYFSTQPISNARCHQRVPPRYALQCLLARCRFAVAFLSLSRHTSVPVIT